MPDDNLIDGHDVVWWKAQWDAMKAENDLLNPRLDAQVKKNADLVKDHEAEIANLKQAHAAAVEQYHGQVQSTIARINQDHAARLAAQEERLNREHAAQIADLKQKGLLPVQREKHARELAALNAKHAEETNLLH